MSNQTWHALQVVRWGDSLAVRLPAVLVENFKLREGDRVQLRIADDRELDVTRDRSKEAALARLRRLRRPLPPDFSFGRDDANHR